MDEKVTSTNFSEDATNDLLRNTEEVCSAFNKACHGLSDMENLKAEPVLRVDKQDINEESQIFPKLSTEKTKELFHSEVLQAEIAKIMDQKVSKCVSGANSTGINTVIDFEEEPKQCTAEVNQETYNSAESTNHTILKLSLADSKLEDKNVNLKYMPVPRAETISLITDSKASISELSKEGRKIMNQNTDDINLKENSESFRASSRDETGKEKNLEISNLVLNLKASTGNMEKATGDINIADVLEDVLEQTANEIVGKDNGEDILKEFTPEINKIDDFEAILKECSTEVSEMMDQTDENADLNLSVSDSFDSNFEEGRENKNLEAKPIANTDNIEIMDQANKSASNASNFKNVITLNTQKDYVTPNSDKNPTILLTDSADNIENLKAEVKQFKVDSSLKRKTRKRKIPPVSDMVMASIKKIKRNDGASFEDIKKQMEENYPVKVAALLKYNVSKFLKRVVDEGYLEKIDGIDTERYVIKENEISQK